MGVYILRPKPRPKPGPGAPKEERRQTLEKRKPSGAGYRWRGFLVPAGELPRPFLSTFTEFRLRPALHAPQILDWMACYYETNFTGPYGHGSSRLKPHGPKPKPRTKTKAKRRTR